VAGAEQGLSDVIGVRVRDLAAQKPNGERH
jgi:hypothetical protein